MPARVIGIAGYKQVGKDTTGSILASMYGHQRMSLADPLRRIALAADPWVERGLGWRLSTIVRDHGWEFAKEQYPEVRRFLQNLGTEGIRENLGEDIWVDTLIMDSPPAGRVYVPDVRFPNEALALRRDLDALIIRIHRPGYGPGTHASERLVDEIVPDLDIHNDGTLEDLETKIIRSCGI